MGEVIFLMFTQYKSQDTLMVEVYCVRLYQRRKGQDVQKERETQSQAGNKG